MAKHISVLLPNEPGRLEEIAELLKRCLPPVNIWAYHIANVGRAGILQLVCIPHFVALRALTAKYGHYVADSEIVAIKVPNEPGQLFDLLSFLDGRDLVSSYQTLDVDGHAVIILEFGTKGEIDQVRHAISGSAYRLMDSLGEGDGRNE